GRLAIEGASCHGRHSIPQIVITSAEGGDLNKYQSAAADCLQRPLLRRFRFRQRLSRSVDMTSDVKSWLPIVLHFLYPHGTASIGRGGASKIRGCFRGVGLLFFRGV